MRSLSKTTSEVVFWSVMTFINGWSIGRFLAKGDTIYVVFSSVLGVASAIVTVMHVIDLYHDWQDRQYEKKYLASIEFPAIDEEE